MRTARRGRHEFGAHLLDVVFRHGARHRSARPKASAEGAIVSHEPSSAPWILERFVGCVSSQ
jgi:hypothetical protein